MKLLLALLIVYAASDVAHDRVFQRSFLYQTPKIVKCELKPLIWYGQNHSIKGYFEKSWCCVKQQHQVNCR
ncbi:MAG: hypothetical protein JSS07_01435 [Proteobacteria bacterium]|nr:hypothetical protein [Pseudomonadota bacterium]